MSEPYKSRVYTDRPAYANFEAPAKFDAIRSIVAKRLIEHPNAMCSYSGGSDSDILLHLIEGVRKEFDLPPVKYAFFNTGLEMKAIKQHVKDMAEKYGVEITEYRPKKNIVLATREYGLPFVSKIMSAGLEGVQKKNIPLSIYDEYNGADDKAAKYQELTERYPGCKTTINFLCCCNSKGEPRPDIQLVINSSDYMLDFIKENPIPFKVSNRCCEICKKNTAHRVQKDFDMVITGERRDEGGMRSVPRKDSTSMCFSETADGLILRSSKEIKTMTLELKQYKSDFFNNSTKPYRLGGVESITNDTAYGEGYFAITIFDTKVFVASVFEYVKDVGSGKMFVKNGKWEG